ncbi:hypothetical protein KVR01_013110 [Diaporthe batatas]|uniref:uncharacterized protein n=1 Tax=Diaporthe batatas TaxID=748121 RepID=UPI001D0479C5|nr:uncharacterized protein KVR01_013110 [Diaporthe batatas]KAG8157120.1 hypothetical protein KVR01_013110 [Diaporthe batatas]
MSEAKVSKSALPKGYAFVPKGNVYITSNCRKQTQERDRPVFTVIDARGRQIGIGVPTSIYLAVQFRETETRADRAANVLKRDEGLARGFEKDIVKAFPQIPPSSLRSVSRIALEKGKGKVGRTGKLDVQRKVHLAVRAHVRHCETDYDKLLRSGVAREDARQRIEARVQEVCRAWGGGSHAKSGKPAKTPKSPAARLSTKAAQAAKRVNHDDLDQEVDEMETSGLTAADSIDAILREAEAASPAGDNIFARHAMRSQRQDPAVAKASPSNTKVVPTAASFRERRTPKPTTTPTTTPAQPPAANPPAKIRTSRPNTTRLTDHEDRARAQVRRGIAGIGRVENALTRECRRRMSKFRTVEKLYGRISETLADAAVDRIRRSSMARRNLVRRLRLAVRAVQRP